MGRGAGRHARTCTTLTDDEYYYRDGAAMLVNCLAVSVYTRTVVSFYNISARTRVDEVMYEHVILFHVVPPRYLPGLARSLLDPGLDLDWHLPPPGPRACEVGRQKRRAAMKQAESVNRQSCPFNRPTIMK